METASINPVFKVGNRDGETGTTLTIVSQYLSFRQLQSGRKKYLRPAFRVVYSERLNHRSASAFAYVPVKTRLNGTTLRFAHLEPNLKFIVCNPRYLLHPQIFFCLNGLITSLCCFCFLSKQIYSGFLQLT